MNSSNWSFAKASHRLCAQLLLFVEIGSTRRVKRHGFKRYWWGVEPDLYNVISFWLLISASDQVFSTIITVEVVFRPWKVLSINYWVKRGFPPLITGFNHLSTVTLQRDRHSLSLLGCSWEGFPPSSLGILSPKEVQGVSGGCKSWSLLWFQLPCLCNIRCEVKFAESYQFLFWEDQYKINKRKWNLHPSWWCKPGLDIPRGLPSGRLC